MKIEEKRKKAKEQVEEMLSIFKESINNKIDFILDHIGRLPEPMQEELLNDNYLLVKFIIDILMQKRLFHPLTKDYEKIEKEISKWI